MFGSSKELSNAMSKSRKKEDDKEVYKNFISSMVPSLVLIFHKIDFEEMLVLTKLEHIFGNST